MASRRQSLKALAEERGMGRINVCFERIEGGCWWWAMAGVGCDSVEINAPTRRAAEAGLRACLEALPLKRKGRG